MLRWPLASQVLLLGGVLWAVSANETGDLK
jgi:hypothetical protein